MIDWKRYLKYIVVWYFCAHFQITPWASALVNNFPSSRWWSLKPIKIFYWSVQPDIVLKQYLENAGCSTSLLSWRHRCPHRTKVWHVSVLGRVSSGVNLIRREVCARKGFCMRILAWHLQLISKRDPFYSPGKQMQKNVISFFHPSLQKICFEKSFMDYVGVTEYKYTDLFISSAFVKTSQSHDSHSCKKNHWISPLFMWHDITLTTPRWVSWSSESSKRSSEYILKPDIYPTDLCSGPGVTLEI